MLVVASPCALMAAIMPTLLSGIAKGAKVGILFKSGAQLEKIGQVRAIAFDKTGTLTTGQPQVVQVIPLEGKSDNQVLQIAATLEAFSEHPIGEAIVKAAKIKNLVWASGKNINTHPGLGITGEVEGITVMVGRESFITHLLPSEDMNLIESSQQLEEEGKTVVWVAANNKVIGLIALADTIRPEAAKMIKSLKELGIEEIVMLTGDNFGSAKHIAQQLGISKVYAEVLPEEKLTIIKNLQKQYQSVAMVGDGINDAPALATATVGIAMGGAGSDVALETADIILMADSLEKLEQAISLGRRAQQIVKQNVIFALSFIVLLLITNFTGDITMPLGVIGHEGSTVLVTLSGLRLLR